MGHEQGEEAGRRLEQLGGHIEVVRAERLAPGDVPAVQVRRRLVVELGEHDVEERDVDLPALAFVHLRDERQRGHDRRRVVDGGIAGERGGPVGLTGQAGDADAGLDDVVEGGPLGGRALEAVPGDGDTHDARVESAQRLVAEAELPDRGRT